MASDSNAAARPSESTAANAVHGPFTQSTRCRSSRQGRGCSKQCVRRGERDHGRRSCARHLPRPQRSQGRQRRVEPDADPLRHAGKRAQYQKATNDAVAQNNNGLEVHGDATSPLQGFLWRPMRPGVEATGLDALQACDRQHSNASTKSAVTLPIPRCRCESARAPGVDIGSRYLSLRNSPGRVGCAALQRGCTRTVRPRRKGLCSEVRARSESERTTRCRLHAADADSAPIQRSFPVAIGCADGHARRIHSSRRLHEHRARHRRRLRRHQVRPWR